MASALYRKYRPRSLDEVIGQEQVTKILATSISQKKISHAYLFVGARGTGKTSVARIFAHAINGFKYELEDSYVDIIEIDGASNRGIDNIRELREKAAISPTEGKYKVYIIDEVHMLTKEAFNALLKTLEEPPKHVVFIMATTDVYKVPATITSRAQKFTFNLASQETILHFLEDVAKKEGIKISSDALKIVAVKGGGSFRDSLSLLDQISALSDQEITKELIISSLGIPDDNLMRELLEEYKKGYIKKITAILKQALNSGVKPETLTEELLNHIIDNPEPTFLPLLDKLTRVQTPFTDAKLLLALLPPEMLEYKPSKQPEGNAISVGGSEVFDWSKFLEKIHNLNDVVFSQLNKCKHEVEGRTLHIFPTNKITKNILESKNNKKLLDQNFSGDVVIRSLNDKPKNQKEDATITKISGIMGGKVEKDGGKNPFN